MPPLLAFRLWVFQLRLDQWREYRVCWCPTPQDCRPCISWKKAAWKKGRNEVSTQNPLDSTFSGLNQSRLLPTLPRSGLVFWQNLPGAMEALRPKF